MRKMTVAGVLAVGAIALAAGSASTASNTLNVDALAGYGSVTVTGATATSIDYTLSAAGTQITGADLVFAGDLRGNEVTAGFGSGAPQSCTVGTYTAPDGLLGVEETTAVSCTGFSQATADATTFNVAVS